MCGQVAGEHTGASLNSRPLERDARANSSTRVHANLGGARRTTWPEQHKWADANRGDHDAEHASEQAQHKALGQTLPDQSAPRRAEGSAQTELTLARDGTRQQQTGDVCDRDQEHQADGAEQQPERRPDIPDVRTERLRDEGATRIRRRVLLGQAAAQPRQLRLRPLQGDTGLKARPHLEAGMHPAILHSPIGVLTERREHVGVSELETRGSDTDDGVGLSFEDQCRPDRGGASAVVAPP